MKEQFIQGSLLDNRFETISPLNHGSFGMVFLAKDLKTDEQVAIKCLTKAAYNSQQSSSLAEDHLVELTCHNVLGNHPNIVNLVHAFETNAHMFLVLEFCPMGDLYEAIRVDRGPLQTDHVRSFMMQLIGAVEHMHSKGLYHRDIKPENIFLCNDGSMKLGDFGLSTTETWTHEVSVGSDRYMAPEQYDPAETGYSPAQADIWAIGICLLNILFARNPFVTPSESDVLFADFVRDRQSLFDIFPAMSQDTFEVLTHSLTLDPNKRSLSAFREAMERVVSFTTEDEIYDDFLNDDRTLVPVSANRQPLRTPSIQSPLVEQNGAFPWAKALHMSPPQTSRQLSTIHDTETDFDELFPGDKTPSQYPKDVQTPSLSSVIDSALGQSVKSMQLREPKPRATYKSSAVSESLPIKPSKSISAMSMLFGKTKDMVSKSWSDMLEDEEEELEDSRTRFNTQNFSTDSFAEEDITVHRAPVDELKRCPIDISRTPQPMSLGIYESSTEDLSPLTSVDSVDKTKYKPDIYSPPHTRSTFGDKWAALGANRRAYRPGQDEKHKNKQEQEKPAKIENTSKKHSGSGGLWSRWGAVTNKDTNGNNGMGVFGTRKTGLWGKRDPSRKYQQDNNALGAFSGSKTRDVWTRRDTREENNIEFRRNSAYEESDWVGGWDNLHL
jgi:serine/threonine protein kinase